MIARGTLEVTRWLGLLFAAVSLLLLMQRMLGVGPSAAAGDFVASYHSLFYPLANLFEPVVAAIFDFVRLALPIWWRDGFVLYLMFGAAHYRHLTNEVSSIVAALFVRDADVGQARPGASVLMVAFVCAIVWPLSLLVLPLTDFAARVFIDPARAVERYFQFYTQVLLQVGVLAAGSVLFLMFDAGLR